MDADTVRRLPPIDELPDTAKYDPHYDLEYEIEDALADERYQELSEKYFFDDAHNVKNLPRSSNIRDYYPNHEDRLGRQYRNDLFFQLRENEQQQYAADKQFWLKEFEKKGYNPDSQIIDDLADYHAGTKFINWLNNLDDKSPIKHYYYRHPKMQKYIYDPTRESLDFDAAMDELGEELLDFQEDFFDFTDFFGIDFGS